MWRAVDHEGEVLDMLVQRQREATIYMDSGRRPGTIITATGPLHSGLDLGAGWAIGATVAAPPAAAISVAGSPYYLGRPLRSERRQYSVVPQGQTEPKVCCLTAEEDGLELVREASRD